MAATIGVTITNDIVANDGECPLWEAIIAANTNTDYNGCVRSGTENSDTIVLQAGQTYTLSRDTTAGDDDTAAKDDLDIADTSTAGTLTIQGNEAIIQRDPNLPCNPDGAIASG